MFKWGIWGVKGLESGAMCVYSPIIVVKFHGVLFRGCYIAGHEIVPAYSLCNIAQYP